MEKEGKPVFFGCALDSDERDESVQEKQAAMGSAIEGIDPYHSVMKLIRNEVPSELFEEIGPLDVPPWLMPIPPATEQSNIHVENFVSFIDQGGCKTFSEMIGNHLIEKIYPDIPCMIAIDHSLTGGVFKTLVKHVNPKDISLVVLDSHTDALPASVSTGAIAYDMETNPDSRYDPHDPFLNDRPDSYNAASFLQELLSKNLVLPENLYILGIGDYPPKRSFRIKDPRIKRYTGHFKGLKNKGVTLLDKKSLSTQPSKVQNIIRAISTPFLYISIDMDVGAGNALSGVRFTNRQGLNETQIYNLSKLLAEIISGGIHLLGMDLTEFNPRTAALPGDRTYRIAANLIRKLCFSLTEVSYNNVP